MQQTEQEDKYSHVYSSLSRQRFIFLTDELTKDIATNLCSLLIYYNSISQTEPITLFINTVGGDTAALASIYDVMSMIVAPVSTIGAGKIYSGGAFLLAAGSKGNRFIFKNAEVMIHGLQCTYPEHHLSNQTDSTIYFNYLESLNNRIMKILAKHTGQAISKIQKDVKRDLYMTAPTALKYGIVDKIL